MCVLLSYRIIVIQEKSFNFVKIERRFILPDPATQFNPHTIIILRTSQHLNPLTLFAK